MTTGTRRRRGRGGANASGGLRRGLAPARRWLAPAIHVGVLLGVIAGFVWLAPASHWSDPVLLAALAVMAMAAATAEEVLKVSAPARLDATLPLVLLALLAGGPLPALIVSCTGELVSRIVLRRAPVLSVGFLGTLVSYGAGVLAASEVLALAGAGSMTQAAPVLFLAGFAHITINFTLARMVTAVLWQGFPAPRIAREFVGDQPLIVAMLLLAVVTGLAMAAVGILALVLIAPLALLPYLAAFLRSRSMRGMSRVRAAQLYAHSLAAALGMSRRDRRRAAVAAGMHLSGGVPAGTRMRDNTLHARMLAWHAGERWDGAGGPAALAGRHIPMPSRVAAVAAAWASLTARGGPELPHVQALLDLELRAGTELDPTVVAAAGELIAEEQACAGARSSARPVLHALPLPAGGRRAVGRVLSSCASL